MRAPGKRRAKFQPKLHSFSLHKPGYRVPDWLTRRIQRCYPSVRIVWNYLFKRWMLVYRVAGGYEIIGKLETRDGKYVRPNMRNTLGYLHRASTRNLRSKWALEAWLKDLDSPEEAARAALEARVKDQVEEGSKELFNQLQGRIVVPRLVVPGVMEPRPRPGRSVGRLKRGKMVWNR